MVTGNDDHTITVVTCHLLLHNDVVPVLQYDMVHYLVLSIHPYTTACRHNKVLNDSVDAP